MKICYRCKVEYPIDHFYKDRSKKDGRTPYCRACRKEKAREQYLKNPKLAIDRAHARRAEHGIALDISRMGISIDRYIEMVEAQESRCAVCGEEEKYKTSSGVVRRLSIDHDHKCCPQRRDICGECVRGLLCSRCNQVLGKVADDVELLTKMIGYLNSWNSQAKAQ